jgi:CheY-like chemotaxis protein
VGVRPRRILVVDDNRLIRRLLELVLEEAGYAPVPAESGEVALDLAREDPPDACIVDQEMPGMKGADFVRALRLSRDMRLAELPAIGVSAYPAAEAELRGAGASAFLRKPLDEDEILAALAGALHRHRLAEIAGAPGAA